MTLNLQRCRDFLNAFAFEKLFIDELGWDRHAAQVVIEIDGRNYSRRAVAEKRGVQVFECRVEAGQAFPDYSTRKKIEKQLAKTAYEHLIIFTDAERTVQIWQWVAGHPASRTPIAKFPTTRGHNPATSCSRNSKPSVSPLTKRRPSTSPESPISSGTPLIATPSPNGFITASWKSTPLF